MQPQYIILPKQAKNITGQRFVRLVALGPIERNHNSRIVWECQCDCGNVTRVTANALLRGNTKSCGCLKIDLHLERNTTHGMRHDPLYQKWLGIIQRCTNPHNPGYGDYGGRGIVVCTEWQVSFESFYDHVSQLLHYGKSEHSLDRIDNSLGYFPGNVRWATHVQQNRNTRANHMIEYGGKSQCIAQWANELGIGYQTLRARLFRYGWSVERAFTASLWSRS